jgi:hypothetical protein
MAHKEKVKVTEIRVEKVTPERCRIRMQKRKAENQQHQKGKYNVGPTLIAPYVTMLDCLKQTPPAFLTNLRIFI